MNSGAKLGKCSTAMPCTGLMLSPGSAGSSLLMSSFLCAFQACSYLSSSAPFATGGSAPGSTSV
eukprot:3518549-Prymnesium_polylepis.1